MAAINKMVATEYSNVRQRLLDNGDTAYYIRHKNSFTMVGLLSQGITSKIAYYALLQLRDQNREQASQQSQQSVNKLTERKQSNVTSSIVTLDTVYEKHKSYIKLQSRPTKHAIDSLVRYERYIRPVLGSMSLEQIESGHIASIHADIKRRFSESMAYHVCHFIRYLFNRAREWKLYTGTTPMGRGTSFMLPMPQRKREEIYTKDELSAILTELKTHSVMVHDMVIVSLTTGLRFGEITKLQVCHVNQATRRIKVVDPKGKRDTYVQLPQVTFDLLQRRITSTPTDLLFPGANGKQIKCLSKTFRKTLDKLGVNDGVSDSRFKKTFHSLRHTFATELMASGQVSIIELRDLLGHKSVKTTERYTHASERAMVAASRFMNNMVNDIL